MLEQADLFNWNESKPTSKKRVPMEWKVVALRECPVPDKLALCETADHAAEYWNAQIKRHPYFNPDCECFAVLLLNTRLRIKGHVIVAIGTLNGILVHPREVFRAAVVSASARILLMHNHPSGDPSPSAEDIRTTRTLVEAGKVIHIEVTDHVIVGNGNRVSLKEMGYMY